MVAGQKKPIPAQETPAREEHLHENAAGIPPEIDGHSGRLSPGELAFQSRQESQSLHRCHEIDLEACDLPGNHLFR
jgi:hypothetical protein